MDKHAFVAQVILAWRAFVSELHSLFSLFIGRRGRNVCGKGCFFQNKGEGTSDAYYNNNIYFLLLLRRSRFVGVGQQLHRFPLMGAIKHS